MADKGGQKRNERTRDTVTGTCTVLRGTEGAENVTEGRAAAGMLLRLARIRQGKGQKEICHGICVVSYLSKIERGKGNPEETILKQLFGRLGIVYETDSGFLQRCRQQIQEYFYRNLYELGKREIYEELKRQEERLLYSPLAVDWLLIAGLEGEERLALLEELTDSMTQEQLAYFYGLKAAAEKHIEKKLWYSERVAVLLGNTFGLRQLLDACFMAGNYNAIHYMENRFVALALEEGNTYALAFYYNINASAYACVNMEEMMVAYYKKAEHLLMNTGWKAEFMPLMCYNMGAVYVSLEKYELALSYLKEADKHDFLLWHKMGLAYLGLSDKKGVGQCLEKMREFLDAGTEISGAPAESVEGRQGAGHVEFLMYEELRMRCEPGYRENPAYLETLERLLAALKKERTFGFLYAYRGVVREVYTAQRKYRKALEFELEVSSKIQNGAFQYEIL